MDVVSLYSNILHYEKLSALRKRLDDRDEKDKCWTTVELAELVLKNIFNFNEKTFKIKKEAQQLGESYLSLQSFIYGKIREKKYWKSW